jgi:folate-dependent phosphoribosylglycinamide formyltransferase PurN
MNNRPWITFFTQTGSEIANLVKSQNKVPDCIITNRENLDGVCSELKEIINNGCKIVFISKKPTHREYEEILKKYKDPLITLHGYLRIIPPEICNKYEIYNLHPGLITEYPELKGKDPQVRAFEGKYPKAGCVIHRVIPEVDCGEVVATYPILIEGYTKERVFYELKVIGVMLWNDFFKKIKASET